MSLCQFVDIVSGDLIQGEAELVGAGRDVPEHIAKFVFELCTSFVGYHAARIALDLFDDVRHLPRFAGKAERRVFKILEAPRVESRLARF